MLENYDDVYFNADSDCCKTVKFCKKEGPTGPTAPMFLSTQI